jgi:hypothetical protein
MPARVVQPGAIYLFGVAMAHWEIAALRLTWALGVPACIAPGVMSGRLRGSVTPCRDVFVSHFRTVAFNALLFLRCARQPAVTGAFRSSIA